jgi:hypothetical protein
MELLGHGDYYPKMMIIDASDAERLGIEMSRWWPRTRWILCIWHVLRCWVRNLRVKVPNAALRLEIMGVWKKIMYGDGRAEARRHVMLSFACSVSRL